MAGQEVQGMLIRLEATTAQLRQEMARADSSVAQASGRIDRQLAQVDSAFDRLGLSAQRVGGVLKGALAIGIGGAGIGALVSQAEAYTQIANRLKLVTSNSAEFTAAQNSVFSIAQKAGQPLGATAELYQRIAQNQDALKLSGKGVAGIVETISKTMVISGASAASSEAALIQLGQAFASGTLRGEELNSVMEQAPALSQAIAKGMGVSIGALRALGAEGNLTAESVVKALQAQADAVNELFGKMQDTIGTGLTRVQTSFTKMIGEGDKVGGMSARISAALTSASRAMDAITADGDAFAETVKNLGNALENMAYVGAAALALGAGKMAVSFAQATLASVQQAGALALTTKASLEALTAEAALARQSLLTAQTRQLEAKALVERAGLELAAAEGKVASDRVRQASELGNLKLVQATLTAERELEGQRLKAQITDQGRTLSIARIAELRTAEAGAIKLVQAAEVSLAATTVATSAEITAALGAQTAARGVLAETTATTNAAMVASDRAAGAASAGAKAALALSTASRGLLALLTGPVGLIAMTGLVAASFIDFGGSADAATKSLLDNGLAVDEAIKKYNELNAAQQRFQRMTWLEEQSKAMDGASSALDDYSYKIERAFDLGGKKAADFRQMIDEVAAGTRSIDSITEWVIKNSNANATLQKELVGIAAEYQKSSEKAAEVAAKLRGVEVATKGATSSTEKLTAAQQGSGQTDAVKASWDKYVEQLTKTRDLLGANAAAEAAYSAAKMGATPAQAAQAKLIADQTDALKKYQDAIKEGDKVQQASLKLQLVALYTAEDATTQAAATQSKAYADTATAAENSARRQITAIEQAANFAVVSATRVALGASAPQTNLSGYGLLTNGGTAPAVPAVPTATPNQRADAAIAQLNATTEANKNVDKAANAAATAIKNQEKALTDLLAKSGISTKSANEMADAYLSGADNIRAITIQQKIEEELLKAGAGARDKVTAAVNALQDAEDRRDVAKNISEMKVEVDQILKQATATLQGKDALEAYNIEKAMAIALSGKKIAIGSEEYKQLLATTKAQLDANKALEQAGKVEGIVDRLNPQIKLLKDYTAEQDALNAAIGRYPANAALYQDALVKLGNEYEVNRSKTTLWGQMTEGAIDRIDEAFATAWGNIGDGAESLWDNLKKGFKQTLGEIAHMLTTKPLLASISNWLTGTDNGQGVGSVWSKLLGSVGGSSGSGSSGSSGGFGGMVDMGKSLYQAYSAITGVGSSMATGYASGGVSGAISGGAGYYSSMLSSLGSTISSGFSSMVGAVTGSTAATTGATSALGATLSGAVAEGAAAVGTNIGVAGATTAAASQGLGAQITAAMGNVAAMWPLAVVMGMYQSGKLYDAGVRPDSGEIMDSGGKTAAGKAVMAPGAAMSKGFAIIDDALSPIVGEKWAAILSGSTFHQAVTKYVGEKLFGGAWQTKNSGISLGVEDGQFEAQQYADQKKKGGLFSSSKKRTRYGALDSSTADVIGGQYNQTILGALDLFSMLTVSLDEHVLDGLNIAKTKISTKNKSEEQIQGALNDWFTKLGNTAVSTISAATNAGLEGFSLDGLTTFVNNLYEVNARFDGLGMKVVDFSVAGGRAVDYLAAMAGGMDALRTNIAGYYDAFTSDTQKATDSLEAVRAQFAQLGVALPETEAGYKSMLKSLDMTTGYGQTMFNAMTANAASAASAYAILEQRQSDYYGAFYSEAENTARAIAETTAQIKELGVTLPGTKDAFRDMVESATKDTTASGQAWKDTLLSVAGAAGAVFDALESQAQAAADAAQAAAEVVAAAAQAAADAQANYYNLFTSDTQKAADTVGAFSEQMNALGLALPATHDGFAAIVASIDRTTESGMAMFGSLMGIASSADAALNILESQAKAAADAVALAAQAITDALNAAVSSSFSAVQRSISAQQQAATDAYNATTSSLSDMAAAASSNISDLTSVGNDLSSALKALRGDSDDAVKMLRAQAVATLQSALATSRAGGSLSGITGLSDALDTIGSNNTDLYGSMEDFARDQGRTANVVAELNGINGKQLSSAEKSLRGLEDQIDLAKSAYDLQMSQYDSDLAFAQAQLDALNGIDNSIMGLSAALAAMRSATVAALQVQPAGAAQANTPQNNGTIVDALYQSVLGRGADADGKAYWTDKLQSGALSYQQIAESLAKGALAFDSGSYTGPVSQDALAASKAAAQKYLDSIKGFATGGLISGPGTGTSDSILSRLSNGEYVMSADSVRMFGTGLLDQMNAGRLPAFAAGGGVGEAGPQLEVTGPSRIYSANQAAAMLRGGGDFGALLSELKQTREENKSQRFQIAKTNQQVAALLQKWDAEGAPQEREYAL